MGVCGPSDSAPGSFLSFDHNIMTPQAHNDIIATRLLSRAFHWQPWHRQVITLFIYDLRNSQYTNAWRNTQGCPQCLWPVVQGQFTLKLIWSHCARSSSLCSRPLSQKEATVRNYLQLQIPQCSSKGRVSTSVNNNTPVSQSWPLCLLPGISHLLLGRGGFFMVTNTWNTTMAGWKDATETPARLKITSSFGFWRAQWFFDGVQLTRIACLKKLDKASWV